jgi:hypothetical protein
MKILNVEKKKRKKQVHLVSLDAILRTNERNADMVVLAPRPHGGRDFGYLSFSSRNFIQQVLAISVCHDIANGGWNNGAQHCYWSLCPTCNPVDQPAIRSSISG